MAAETLVSMKRKEIDIEKEKNLKVKFAIKICFQGVLLARLIRDHSQVFQVLVASLT